MPVSGTFRQDLRNALYAQLEAWQQNGSNANLLPDVYRARRPDHLGASAYVGSMSEEYLHQGALRMRNIQVGVIVEDTAYENAEAVMTRDVVVDSLVDHFSNNPRAVLDTVLEPISASDADEASYLLTTIILRGSIREGVD